MHKTGFRFSIVAFAWEIYLHIQRTVRIEGFNVIVKKIVLISHICMQVNKAMFYYCAH